MSARFTLESIMNARQHWVYPERDNPLTRTVVIRICRNYQGDGTFQNFKEYAQVSVEELADVLIDPQVIWELFNRQKEFLDETVEE